MKILELKAEKVKRLKAVHIKPDGSPLVIIGGNNGEGKSSTLDSIWYALGGKGALPPKPVREGEQEASITLDLGDFIVQRTITPDGKSTLRLTGKDGGKFTSPQTILDAMVGNLTFDPLEFSRMDSRKQLDTLKGLVGLDFSAIDRQKAAKSEERLYIGREVKQLEGQLAGLPHHADAPAAEVSVAELSSELQKAREANRAKEQAAQAQRDAQQTLAQWIDERERLKKELAEAEEQVKKWTVIDGQKKAAYLLLSSVCEQTIIDRMSSTDAVNRKVRENAQRAQVAAKLKQKQDAYAAMTSAIEQLDGQKAQQLAAAKFPVGGLSFDESGVLVNGLPFQQASSAEQLRVSVAMGLALNPKLKVLLIRDGSLLDEKSLAMVAQMAEAAGGQVWMERVSNGPECNVIIEDGTVVQRGPADKALPRQLAKMLDVEKSHAGT